MKKENFLKTLAKFINIERSKPTMEVRSKSKVETFHAGEGDWGEDGEGSSGDPKSLN